MNEAGSTSPLLIAASPEPPLQAISRRKRLLVALVLGFILDRMTGAMLDRLSNPRLDAFSRHLVEYRSTTREFASSR